MGHFRHKSEIKQNYNQSKSYLMNIYMSVRTYIHVYTNKKEYTEYKLIYTEKRKNIYIN